MTYFLPFQGGPLYPFAIALGGMMREPGHEWRWNEHALAWVYCKLGEWSVPHQEYHCRPILYVYKELLRDVLPELRHLIFEEAVRRSHAL